ncbi:MAG TPA: MBL fold metallo-hydrolase, partial [Gammaproteobacteria bacterium]|nr:MBL fold metallo-hydrolase [Gammaproteobacteria bacterium]
FDHLARARGVRDVSPGGTHLLLDPFLTKNPATPSEYKDLARYHPSHILVTHSHGDHLGDAVELAKLSKAKVVSVMMLDTFVNKGGLPRDQIETINVGDQVTAGDVKIHVVPAMHSSEPSGRPVGYVLEFNDGRTLYEGDTWIFGDMSLIQEFYHPNIILIGCGAVADGQYADGMAYGESLLQAASGYSNALRRIARVIERGRHSRRSRKRCASEVYETGRDAKVVASGAWSFWLFNYRLQRHEF